MITAALDLSLSVAFVTGGNRGIGKAVCEGLAEKGIHVMVGSRSTSAGEKTVNAIRNKGGSAKVVEIDIQSVESVNAAAHKISESHSTLNILVNNAGILAREDRKSRFGFLPEKVLKKTMDVNLFGPFRVCQAFLPLLQQAVWGRIVNVTSGLGNLSDPMTGGYTAYRVSKSALNALTANLAAEVENSNILVNCVHPGWVRTRMGTMIAPLSPKKGADSIIYAATLPSGGPHGKYIVKRQVQPF